MSRPQSTLAVSEENATRTVKHANAINSAPVTSVCWTVDNNGDDDDYDDDDYGDNDGDNDDDCEDNDDDNDDEYSDNDETAMAVITMTMAVIIMMTMTTTKMTMMTETLRDINNDGGSYGCLSGIMLSNV